MRSLSVLAIALIAPGCGLVLDSSPPDDAAIADAGGLDGGAIDVDAATIADAAIDAPIDDAAIDAPVTDAAPDAGPVECVAASDCDALLGPPPCGAWACNAANTCDVVCAGCTDLDLDGYGVGAGCAGGDCDDADDLVGRTASASCYGGPAGTEGVGACVAGVTDCVDGTWSGCLGGTVPTPESCNGVDDDCNGATDELAGTISCGVGACATTAPACTGGALGTCTPLGAITTVDGCDGVDSDCDGRIDDDCTSCVWVSPAGDDGALDPRVIATPFRTVQAAIDWAAADATRPQRVCLLSNGCSSGPAVFTGPVTMAPGVAVQGNFAIGGLTRCTAAPTPRTEIRTGTPTGVLFPSSIAVTTEISDVAIVPHAPASDSAGITVEGATGAVIRGVYVPPSSGTVTRGWGVDVRSGGDATITRSAIFGGRGSTESVGIRVEGARADIVDNCPSYDASGRCNMECGYMTTREGVRGRQENSGVLSATSHAILLRDAPGSVVARTATCGQVGASSSSVRIEGDATGTIVTRSFVGGWGGQSSSWGIDLAGCDGASPWITDNFEINGEGGMTTPQGGIRSLGDCHPVIQRNRRIIAGLEGRGLTNGILCGADGSGVASLCVIEDNAEIRGAGAGFPTQSTGVRCEAGACARIVRNVITGFQGVDVIGLVLRGSAALVDRNTITGGCGTTQVIGVLADGAGARIQNDVIVAGTCAAGTSGGASRWVALAVTGSDPAAGLDVRSCDLDPRVQLTSACTSVGIGIASSGGAPLGTYRGNIVLAGGCATAYPILEADAGSDPLALESNDLVPAPMRAVYRDEGTTDVATAAAVDALGDARLGGNLDVGPMFVAYPADLHLLGTSPLRDADGAPGAPAYDFDGRPRVPPPDIGAFEH